MGAHPAAAPPAVIILVGEVGHVAPLAEHLRPGHEIRRAVGHGDLRAVEEGEGQPALLGLVILPGRGGVGVVHVPAGPGRCSPGVGEDGWRSSGSGGRRGPG